MLTVVVLFTAIIFAIWLAFRAAVDPAVEQLATDFADFVQTDEYAIGSPDGSWSLLLSVRDEGAFGGSTSVFLLPSPEGSQPRKVSLYYGGFDPVLPVAWLDARTVDIDGQLMMPFIEHSVATGSIRTTGAGVDLFGYACNLIPAGERVAMQSGLSCVLPENLQGLLLTERAAGELARPRQQLTLLPTDASTQAFDYRVLALPEPAYSAHWAVVRDGQLLGGSRSGTIEVRWNKDERVLAVVTRLPDRMAGMIMQTEVDFASPEDARAGAERLWTTLSVEGAGLPWTALH